MGTAEGSYQLGVDATELERLDLQGRMLAPATQTILQVAGLDRGMRILDLGCGAGDVSFVAAELVGATGEIIGVDQSADSVAKASARARARGQANVRFTVGDIHEPATAAGSPAGRGSLSPAGSGRTRFPLSDKRGSRPRSPRRTLLGSADMDGTTGVTRGLWFSSRHHGLGDKAIS
jgi:SAM-dependent methyltransferase